MGCFADKSKDKVGTLALTLISSALAKDKHLDRSEAPCVCEGPPSAFLGLSSADRALCLGLPAWHRGSAGDFIE